jgi:hypothetical protein
MMPKRAKRLSDVILDPALFVVDIAVTTLVRAAKAGEEAA